MNRLTCLLAVGVCAGLLAACGGSDDPVPPPAAPPAVVAPTITSQPAAVAVSEGQSASFSVVAAGTAPLSYAWRRNGSTIAGANAATYTLAAATLADNAAVFSVVVSNSAGSVTSAGGALTVNALAVAPAITTQPAAASLTAGGSATFSVAVSGTPAPTVQWQIAGGADLADGPGSGALAGASIAGAATATLTLTNVPVTANGLQLAARATNSAGTVTSASAALTVGSAGVVISAAAGGTVRSDDGRVTLTIPPGALTADATWRISRSTSLTPPAAFNGDIQPAGSGGYVLVGEGGELAAGQRLSVRLADAAGQSSATAAVRPLSNPPVDPRGFDALASDCPDGSDPLVFFPVPSGDGELVAAIRGCSAVINPQNQRPRSQTTIVPSRLLIRTPQPQWARFTAINATTTLLQGFDHWQVANGLSRTAVVVAGGGSAGRAFVFDETGTPLIERSVAAELPNPPPSGLIQRGTENTVTAARLAGVGTLYVLARRDDYADPIDSAGTRPLLRSQSVLIRYDAVLGPGGLRLDAAWTRVIGGTLGQVTGTGIQTQVVGAVSNEPLQIAVDRGNGDVLVLGTGASSDAAFNVLAPGAGGPREFLARFAAANGDLRFVRRVHGPVVNQAFASPATLAVDGNGNTYVAARTAGLPDAGYWAALPPAYSADLGTCALSPEPCVIIARFDRSGALTRARYAGETDAYGSLRLGLDRNANVVLAANLIASNGQPTGAIEVLRIDQATGALIGKQALGGVPVSTIFPASLTASVRFDPSNRAVAAVVNNSAFITTAGGLSATRIPNVRSDTSFDFSLDPAGNVILAGASSLPGTACDLPANAFCRGFLLQKFAR